MTIQPNINSAVVVKWNVEGAFVGVVTADIPQRLMDGSDDDRTLVFKTFLAARFLSCDGLYVERKFCGNTDVPQNEDLLGRTIDAYIHHTLLDSGKTLLLSDLQGMSSTLPMEMSTVLDD